MFIVLIVFLVVISILLLVLCFRVLKRILKSKRGLQTVMIVFLVGVTAICVNHFFLKNMRFIQSKVYPNLYLIKYPDKDYELVEKAIKEKIKAHLNTEHKTGKPLAYTDENGIYFYELGGSTFGFIGDAGTGYFLDHEEDLGGFVSEELGMYNDYRLAEFYYEPCKTDSTLLCGVIDYFNEGVFFKVDSLTNLVVLKQYIKNRKNSEAAMVKKNGEAPIVITKNQEENLPIHGALDKDALLKFYPGVSDERSMGSVYVEKIDLPTENGILVSLLRNTVDFQQIFLCTQNKDLNLIDAFYIGKATDFDKGKGETIDYKILPDSTMVFHKVVWGMLLESADNEKSIDTLAHEITTLRVNQKGELSYDISKDPKYYALEAFVINTEPNDAHLKGALNGEIIQTLDIRDEYMLKLVKGKDGWFRVVEVESMNKGKLKMPIGFAWIHRSVIGMRARTNLSVLDKPKSGKPICVIPQDTDVNIMDLKEDWVKIEHRGLKGWVWAEKLCGNPVTTCP